MSESRYPGQNRLPSDSLEQDGGYVATVDTVQLTELDPPHIVTTYSPYYGVATYLHGLGVDQPAALRRSSYGQDSTAFGEVVLNLHYDWRGVVDEGTTNGGQSTADQGYKFDWPGADVRLFGERRSHGVARSWVGGLTDGMRDESGQQYKRNRYLDPHTGRFTQEDPTGLAGGLNLYGFAGGDPVNYDDPFGLCPKNEPDCQALVTAYSATGAAVGFWFGAGTGAGETAVTLGAAAPVAVAQTAGAAALGALAGKLVGEIVFAAKSATSGNSSAAARGREAHGEYSEEMAAQGYDTNRQAIPGTRLRPAAIDIERGIIRELKPNTPTGRPLGPQQLQRYLDAAQKAFGRTFKGILDFTSRSHGQDVRRRILPQPQPTRAPRCSNRRARHAPRTGRRGSRRVPGDVCRN